VGIEAEEMGVKCFTTARFCMECMKVRAVIIREFEIPIIDRDPWGPYDRSVKEYEALCHKCGTKLKEQLDDDIFPKCKKGRFESSSFMMS
jgi:hypothetical protein